jgi:hypothetical protein
MTDSRGTSVPGETPSARIRRPEIVDVRTVWPSEPAHFTPWLADNLDYLELLGLGRLSLIRVEAPVPGTWRSLDVLTETAEGRLIAVENQYGQADHDHLTRGLAYAAGLNAAGLVLIAERHSSEFVAVADYLNRAAEALGVEGGGIGVYLVDLTVESLDGWFIPRFRLLSSPNFFVAAVKAAGPERPAGSVDSFLEALGEPLRTQFRRIVTGWETVPDARVTHSAVHAIALRLPKLARPGDMAVMTLFDDGSTWLNRGYVIESWGPATPEGWVEELDRQIRTHVPGTKWEGKLYHLLVRETVPDEVVALGKWLAEQRVHVAGG